MTDKQMKLAAIAENAAREMAEAIARAVKSGKVRTLYDINTCDLLLYKPGVTKSFRDDILRN